MVPDMLAVAAIEISHPVVFFVLMEGDDFAFHESLPKEREPQLIELPTLNDAVPGQGLDFVITEAQ